MSNTRLITRALALMTSCCLTGCGRSDAVAQPVPVKPYAQLPGWSSECFGRFLVDAPGRMELGEAIPEFLTYSNKPVKRYILGPHPLNPFGGEVIVSLNRLLETKPLANKQNFNFVWMQADTYYDIRVVRDGGPEWETEDRRKASKRLQLPNDAFIWRYQDQFDFGTLVESDMRARMLHGQLSGEGTLARAKAAVDALWPRYRPRKPGEVPSDAGICTPYGFFADPPKLTERDYALSFDFPDPRHPNFIIHLRVRTLGREPTPGRREPPRTPIEQWSTPWEEDEAQAKEAKENCKPKQATETSRDIFGCVFAGVRDIKSHRPVEYLTLQSGQRARLLAYEVHPSINDGEEYRVELQAQGVPESATQPSIELSIRGVGKLSAIPSMQGKEPPSIDEAIATVKTIAASLRLRPGAVADGATVADTLEGVR